MLVKTTCPGGTFEWIFIVQCARAPQPDKPPQTKKTPLMVPKLYQECSKLSKECHLTHKQHTPRKNDRCGQEAKQALPASQGMKKCAHIQSLHLRKTARDVQRVATDKASTAGFGENHQPKGKSHNRQEQNFTSMSDDARECELCELSE